MLCGGHTAEKKTAIEVGDGEGVVAKLPKASADAEAAGWLITATNVVINNYYRTNTAPEDTQK